MDRMSITYRKYKDFDEAFYEINREFLTKPHGFIQYLRGAQSFLEDLVIQVDSPKVSLNLHEHAFNPQSKWQHLIKSYIEPERYWDFWEKISSIGGTSYQFKFRDREGSSGPCLSALILTREDGKDPWTRCKVTFRNSEINRKFAADLVLIYHFLTNPPEGYEQCLDIKEITLFLAQAFQSWRLSGVWVDQFCSWDEVDLTHSHCEKVKANFEKVFLADPQPPIKFAPVRRAQEFWLRKQAGEIPHSHPDELSLIDTIRKIEERRKK
jgi:hypothetical protein